jgi:hypothetical protein
VVPAPPFQSNAQLGASLLGTKRPEAPAYIFHGDIDEVVPYHLVVQLFYSWCSLGATVVFERRARRRIPGIGAASNDMDAGPAEGVACAERLRPLICG